MNRLRLAALALALLTAAAAAFRARPARLLDARVTAITPGAPAVAHVALRYGPGARPISQVVDVRAGAASGSATLSGLALYADVPLAGAPDGPPRVEATAAHRALGRTSLTSASF